MQLHAHTPLQGLLLGGTEPLTRPPPPSCPSLSLLPPLPSSPSLLFSPVSPSSHAPPPPPRLQVVVLSSVLACDATLGYESTLGVRDGVVQRFNGQPIHSLAQVGKEREARRRGRGWREARGVDGQSPANNRWRTCLDGLPAPARVSAPPGWPPGCLQASLVAKPGCCQRCCLPPAPPRTPSSRAVLPSRPCSWRAWWRTAGSSTSASTWRPPARWERVEGECRGGRRVRLMGGDRCLGLSSGTARDPPRHAPLAPTTCAPGCVCRWWWWTLPPRGPAAARSWRITTSWQARRGGGGQGRGCAFTSDGGRPWAGGT